jgi:hypothetical protein
MILIIRWRLFTLYVACNFLHITLMMEAVRTAETSVNFNLTTRPYIPEDSKLLNVFACFRVSYRIFQSK